MLNNKAQDLIKGVFKKKPNLKMTIGVLKNGEATYKLYDTTGEIPYESYSYEIGSVGKVFTTSLLAKYLESGDMMLDDSVSKYITEFGDDRYYPTLKRLALHTAGYPTRLPISKKEMRGLIWGTIRGKQVDILKFLEMDFDKMMALAKSEELKDKDYKWCYSNFGISLLGCAIGRAAGTGYADAMTKFINDELKLTNTIVGKGAQNMLTGYDVKNRDVGSWSLDRDNCVTPAGNFTSCAEDLLEFARINFEEEVSCVKLCHERYNMKNKHSDMGLGWWIDYKQPSIYYHGGNTGGFASMLAFDKEKKTAVTVLTNTQGYGQRDKLFMELLKG